MEPTVELTAQQITAMANDVITKMADISYISPVQADKMYDAFSLIVVMSNENAVAFPMMNISSIAGGYMSGSDLVSLGDQITGLLKGSLTYTANGGVLPTSLAVARMLGANSDQDIFDIIPPDQVSYVDVIGKQTWKNGV